MLLIFAVSTNNLIQNQLPWGSIIWFTDKYELPIFWKARCCCCCYCCHLPDVLSDAHGCGDSLTCCCCCCCCCQCQGVNSRALVGSGMAVLPAVSACRDIGQCRVTSCLYKLCIVFVLPAGQQGTCTCTVFWKHAEVPCAPLTWHLQALSECAIQVKWIWASSCTLHPEEDFTFTAEKTRLLRVTRDLLQ